MATSEDGLGQRRQKVQHRFAALADLRQRDAEQHRDEQHLQDVAADEGAEDGRRDDVHQEAGDGRVMGLGHIARHRLGVQRLGVDVHAGARLHDMADHHADHQGQRREHQEVQHGLACHAADLLQVAHGGDAGGHGQEDDGRDDHLHQLDEAVAQRLHGLSQLRLVVAEQHADHDGEKHLHVQDLIELQLARGRALISVDHGFCPHQGPSSARFSSTGGGALSLYGRPHGRPISPRGRATGCPFLCKRRANLPGHTKHSNPLKNKDFLFSNEHRRILAAKVRTSRR